MGDPNDIISLIQQHFAGILEVDTVEPSGEGDFFQAYTVNANRIFLLAKNAEARITLRREIALLPLLAPRLNVAIPVVDHVAKHPASGQAEAISYRKIVGEPLTSERLAKFSPTERANCARDLGQFLQSLHDFSVKEARSISVPECSYPFCRTEEGILSGSAEEIYDAELNKLLGYTVIGAELAEKCRQVVEQLADRAKRIQNNLCLVHGDLSSDHILYSQEKRRIAGIIDFSDAVLTDPLLDFTYLYSNFGPSFLREILAYSGTQEIERTLYEVKLLNFWCAALRLLWPLEHRWQPGVDRRLPELQALSKELAIR